MPSSGGSGESRQTVTQSFSPEQQRLIDASLPAIEQFALSPPQLFPGSQIAQFTPLETEAQRSAVDVARNQFSQAFAPSLFGQQFLASGAAGLPGANPALQGSIDAATRPIIESLTQNILPSIRGEALTSGQFGGSRQGIAEGLAAQGAQRQVGDTAAQVANESFLRALQAQVGALALAPQTLQQLFGGQQALASVGGAQRQLEQSLLNEEAQRFIAEQTIPFEASRQVAAIAAGLPGGTTTSVGTAPSGSSNVFSSVLGGAATGTAIGAATPLGPAGGAILGGILGGLGTI